MTGNAQGNGVRLVGKLVRDDRGATAIEYGLIMALVFIAMVGAFEVLAGHVIGVWESVNTQVGNVSS